MRIVDNVYQDSMRAAPVDNTRFPTEKAASPALHGSNEATAVKVLYIVGAHRSGTTLLSGVFGSFNGFFSAGELHEIWASSLSGRPCACGKELTECTVWGPILARLTQEHGLNLEKSVQLRAHSARAWHTHKLIRAAQQHRSGEIAGAYTKLMADLYRTIGETTGNRVIVDSTKVPAGGAILPAMPNVDPYILHVVRDPRATCHSWSRAKEAVSDHGDDLGTLSSTSAGLRWLGYNALSEKLADLPETSYHRIRYEDFIRQPQKSIGEVADWLGESVTPNRFTADDAFDIQSGHNVAGNPDRFNSGVCTLRVDARWRDEMPRSRRIYVGALSTPLRRRYQYPFLGET